MLIGWLKLPVNSQEVGRFLGIGQEKGFQVILILDWVDYSFWTLCKKEGLSNLLTSKGRAMPPVRM